MWGIVKQVMKGSTMRMIGLSFIICHLSFSVCACSEENNEVDEYANWQERNDAQTDQWAAGASSGMYRKILTYAKSESASGLTNSDYIYVEEVEKGSGTESPIYTDNVRVAYRGRYIPTTSYPKGYVFDETFVGDFDWKTAGMTDVTPDGLVEGFCTALMHMHKGDRWIVHIPYKLGYGTSTSSGIRAYSDLTFDIAVLEIWPQGEEMEQFKSR
jgi:FKBP-type peptidyl-prolyl cis-trans isomerase FklB